MVINRQQVRQWLAVLVILLPATSISAEPAVVCGDASKGGVEAAICPGQSLLPSPLAREIPALRTRSSKTFDNPDGSRTWASSAVSVHYQNDRRGWDEIDLAIRPLTLDERAASNSPYPAADNSREFVYGMTHNAYRSYFAGNASAQVLAAFATGRWSVAFGLGDACDGRPTIDGNSITYHHVQEAVDIRFTTNVDELREEIILHASPARARWRFPLYTKNVWLERGSAGTLDFVDASTGDRIWFIPRPFMFDCLGARSYDVTKRLEDCDGTWCLIVEANEAWLRDPVRAYPVIIDPTWSRTTASGDAFLYQAKPDTVFAANGIRSGADNLGAARRGLLQWDMTGAPAAKDVLNHAQSMRVHLFCYSVYDSGGRSIRLHRVTEDWNESNATWNNMANAHEESHAVSSNPVWGTGDYVWTWNGYAEGVTIPPIEPGRGLMLRHADAEETVPYRWKVFEDKDNTGGTQAYPRLFIDYFAGQAGDAATGALDAIGGGVALAWARDPDYAGPITVELHVDGKPFRRGTADMDYGALVGPHGWVCLHPAFGPGSHTARAFALGVGPDGTPDGTRVELRYSPRTWTEPADREFWLRSFDGSVQVAFDRKFGGAITKVYDFTNMGNRCLVDWEQAGAMFQPAAWLLPRHDELPAGCQNTPDMWYDNPTLAGFHADGSVGNPIGIMGTDTLAPDPEEFIQYEDNGRTVHFKSRFMRYDFCASSSALMEERQLWDTDFYFEQWADMVGTDGRTLRLQSRITHVGSAGRLVSTRQWPILFAFHLPRAVFWQNGARTDLLNGAPGIGVNPDANWIALLDATRDVGIGMVMPAGMQPMPGLSRFNTGVIGTGQAGEPLSILFTCDGLVDLRTLGTLQGVQPDLENPASGFFLFSPGGSITWTAHYSIGDLDLIRSSAQHVHNGTLAAAFAAEPVTGVAPLAVQFRDASMGQVSTRFWDFGDGSTSSAAHPLHTYTQPGAYDVTLTVTGATGSGSFAQARYVSVLTAERCEGQRICAFEGYDPGEQVMFRSPRSSGQTAAFLAAVPNVAVATNEVAAFDGNRACKVRWSFVDADAQRWFQLTTNDASHVPNPVVHLHRPIRVRLRLDAGSIRLCLGIRETGLDLPVGANGGATGPLEWLGAGMVSSGVPHGRLVTAQPGVWQTLTFTPGVDPIQPFTGDGVLEAEFHKGTIDHLAISSVGQAGPFTLYLDAIEHVCPPDFDRDDDVDQEDFGYLQRCLSGSLLPYESGCEDMDLDSDGHIDHADLNAFLRCMTGPAWVPGS